MAISDLDGLGDFASNTIDNVLAPIAGYLVVEVPKRACPAHRVCKRPSLE